MKKILTLGSMVILATPIVAVVACGEGEENNSEKEKQPQLKPFNSKSDIDSSVTALNLNGIGVWKHNQDFAPRLGTKIRKKGQTYKYELYETTNFKYYVDPTVYFAHNIKVDNHKDWIEALAQEFEKYVNYGVAAHFYNTDKVYFAEKPVIEINAGTGSYSFGGHAGASLVLSQINPKASSWLQNMWKKQFVHTQSYLLLHEYGHHETLMDMSIINDKGLTDFDITGKDSQNFKKAMSSIGNNKFMTYWNESENRGGFGMPDNGIPNPEWITPFGKLDKTQSIFDTPKYNWHSSEFLTRVEDLFETNYPNQFYNSVWEGSLGPSSDIGGMYKYFNHETPLDPSYINQTIDNYKNNVYGFNKKLSLQTKGIVGWAKNEAAKYGQTPSWYYAFQNTTIAPTFIYNIANVVDKDHKITSMRATINGQLVELKVKGYATRYNFNTNFRNDIPEEVINGVFYRYDTTDPKLSQYKDQLHLFKPYNGDKEVKFN